MQYYTNVGLHAFSVIWVIVSECPSKNIIQRIADSKNFSTPQPYNNRVEELALFHPHYQFCSKFTGFIAH